jgi:enediyne biosynthesis protein E4
MHRFLSAIILLVFLVPTRAQALETWGLDQILADIEQLEGDKDPKCYATASRLEDFMYGTPLTDQARFQKNKLQKRLAEIVWRNAADGSDSIGPEEIDASFAKIITFSTDADSSNRLTFPNKVEITISSTDIRQYGAVAYSLRAILAVQQDSMMDPGAEPLQPLAGKAVEVLKQKLDLATLALLQESDAYARAHNEYEIDLKNINRAWLALFKVSEENATRPQSGAVPFTSSKPPLLKKIIQQKINSYAQYNQISNPLFVRNMQVYFARLSWPKDKAKADAFKNGFIEALIGYAIELYKGVVKVAAVNGHQVIEEQDVARFVMHFTPYVVNEYEDVEYFPNLPGGKITIEAYDLDAFRDSGTHWLYLGRALASNEITRYLDADPFAAELLAENVAQFGVLLLREAGLEGAKAGKERLSLELLEAAVQNIQGKISAILSGAGVTSEDQAAIRSATSADDTTRVNARSWFTDVTRSVGIDAMHR